MSLINQMLQDLEKREPENENGVMPAGVTSAPPAKRNRASLIALAGVLVLGAALLVYFFSGKQGEPASQGLVAAPPAVAPTPVPPPALAAVTPPPEQAQAQPEPVRNPVKAEPPKETKKERKLKARELARAKARDKLAAKAKAGVGKIDKSPVLTEAQEMAEALYRQAANSFALGRSTESAEKLRQSLALDPSHASARQLLTKLLLEQRAYEEARGVLREGVRQQPGQLQWTSILARLELDRGDANAARQAVDNAMGFGAQNADFQSLAGAVAQRQGKPGDAADFYRAALRIKPADGRSWVGLGMALEAEGHAAEAKEAFRRALTTESLPPELETLAQRKSR